MTNLTAAQRARKIDAARTRLIAAQALLAAVADDMAAESFALTVDERYQWEGVVHTLTDLDKAVDQIDALVAGAVR
jgi:hypothetical protein